MTNPPADQPAPFKNSSALIRPVSDERGFEVIGHYRYGRGIALRDGSLVLAKGKANAPATVTSQLALSGDLFATLNAQSQGITSVTSTYANPSDAIARLQPEDLQTAGVINPNTGNAQFVPTNSGFVDSAPLGSPAAQGVPSSVEASQLSMALTIAELRAKEPDSPPDANCVCLTGRADIAFINVGYQVKSNISTATPAAGLFESQGLDGSLASPATIAGSTFTTSSIDAAQGGPVGANVALPDGSYLMNRVETFLTQLYIALNGDHQALEKTLRGGSLPPSPSENAAEAGGPLSQPYGDLAPPFSEANRALLGDPAALQGQVDSSLRSINSTWKSFGDNLKNNAQKAALNQKIANEKGDIANLQTEKTNLQKGLSGGSSTVVAGTQTPQQRIDSINQQLAKKNQDLQNDQAQLNQLPAGG